MALRNLVGRMRGTAAAALRLPSGSGTPPPAVPRAFCNKPTQVQVPQKCTHDHPTVEDIIALRESIKEKINATRKYDDDIEKQAKEFATLLKWSFAAIVGFTATGWLIKYSQRA